MKRSKVVVISSSRSLRKRGSKMVETRGRGRRLLQVLKRSRRVQIRKLLVREMLRQKMMRVMMTDMTLLNQERVCMIRAVTLCSVT